MGFNGFFIRYFSLCLEYCCGTGKPPEGILPDNITCKCNSRGVVPMWSLQQAVRLTKPPPSHLLWNSWASEQPQAFAFARPSPSETGSALLGPHRSCLLFT